MKCPFCNSDNVETLGSTFVFDRVVTFYECSDCGEEWEV